MNEMIDRVAAVIGYERPNDDPLITSCYEVARLVIEAMREPTQAMVDAGEGISLMAEPVWLAMINVALKD